VPEAKPSLSSAAEAERLRPLDASIRDILSTPPPTAFIELWEADDDLLQMWQCLLHHFVVHGRYWCGLAGFCASLMQPRQMPRVTSSYNPPSFTVRWMYCSIKSTTPASGIRRRT